MTQEAPEHRLDTPEPVEVCDLPAFSSPAEIYSLVGADMAGLVQEQLRVILLNTQNRVIDIVTVYQGTLRGLEARVAEVVRPAVLANAASMVIVHNHPSGNPEPSIEDIGLTRVFERACVIMDISLLDHVIIGADGRYSSMLCLGHLRYKHSPVQKVQAREGTSTTDGTSSAGRFSTPEAIRAARREAVAIVLYFDGSEYWNDVPLQEYLHKWQQAHHFAAVGLLSTGCLKPVLEMIDRALLEGEGVALNDAAEQAVYDFVHLDIDRQAFLEPAIYGLAQVIDQVYDVDDPAKDPMWGWMERHEARKAAKAEND